MVAYSSLRVRQLRVMWDILGGGNNAGGGVGRQGGATPAGAVLAEAGVGRGEEGDV